MNLQITDKNLFNTLSSASIGEFYFGSHLFGLNDENSDVDWMIVYNKTEDETFSFNWSDHNFQFKTTNRDYLLVSLQDFVRNLLNGNSTYFFELIHDEQIKDSSLRFLYDHRNWFYNYSTIKGYLGLTKRDLKFSIKDHKRFSHAYRSILSAEKIYYNNEYSNSFESNEFEMMRKFKYDLYSKDAKWKFLEEFKEREKDLRSKISEDLNHKRINRFMEVENLRALDRWLIDTTKQYQKIDKEINMDAFYEALENGIEY